MNDVLRALYEHALEKEAGFTNWIQQKAEIVRARQTRQWVPGQDETTKDLMVFVENALGIAKGRYLDATTRALEERKRCEVAYRKLMYKMGHPEQRRHATKAFDPLDPFAMWPIKL